MNKTEEKEKRCLFCGKKLIDEKFLVCLRCKLKGRNYVGSAGEIVAGIAVTVGGVTALLDSSKKN